MHASTCQTYLLCAHRTNLHSFILYLCNHDMRRDLPILEVEIRYYSAFRPPRRLPPINSDAKKYIARPNPQAPPGRHPQITFLKQTLSAEPLSSLPIPTTSGTGCGIIQRALETSTQTQSSTTLFCKERQRKHNNSPIPFPITIKLGLGAGCAGI